MKRAVIVFCSLVVVFAALLSHQLGHFRAGTDVSSDTDESEYEYYDDKEEDLGETKMYSSEPKTAEKADLIEVDTRADSITVLVNRKYRMDKEYVPADLVVPGIRFSFYGTYEKSYVRQVTADALEKLFEEGEKCGVILKGVSGYRSYARQQEIYNRNVSTRGESTTNLVSANPGASEHQTGLAIDVSSESVGCALETSFGDTAEGKWLAKNCHKFGFIIRYPEDKTEITGYSYEPWHIRYVGKKLASHLYKKKITLEEYYQITTKDDKVTEPQPEINDVGDDGMDGPQMTSAPTPKTVREPAAAVRPPAGTSATAVPRATRRPAVTRKPQVTPKPRETKKPKATGKPGTETGPADSQDPVTEPGEASVPSEGEETPASLDDSVDTTYEDASVQ